MFSLIALLMTAAPVHAEQGDLSIGFGAGWYFTPSEAANQSNTTIVPRIGFDVLDPLRLELDFALARGLNDILDVSYRGFNPRLNLSYNPWWDGDIQLVGVVGLGYVSKTALDLNDVEQQRSGLDLVVGPQFRVPIADFLAMRFDGRYVADMSGTANDASALAQGIEITAGFEGRIGLVDKDADDDGFTDDIDECVDQAEDFDGFEDADGCPEADNDGDAVLDADDHCPNEAEDIDDFEDADGCPEADNDQDGLLDADDACPVDAGPAATHGCPDKDSDLVPDARDKCPAKARNPKIAPEKSNGCPAQRVALGAKKIEIFDKVFFETGSATLKEESSSLLDEVAQVLKEHEQITQVQVEGYTDNVGNPKANKKLSQARAQSVVDYLVEAGVSEDRLLAKGFGEEKPVADNDTDEGRAENRRVEFDILKQGGAKKHGAKQDGAKDESGSDSGRERSGE